MSSVIVNFAHPLTDAQKKQIEALTGKPVSRVVDVRCHFDDAAPFPPQVEEMLSQIGVAALVSESIIVNPPSLAAIAIMVMSALSAQFGRTLPILRMRRSDMGEWTIAEIINY